MIPFARCSRALFGNPLPHILALLFLYGCGEQSPGPVAVAPPPDLESVDLSVRKQFLDLWDDAQATQDDNSQAAQAWGRLGLWYQVYQYPDSALICYANSLRLDPTGAQWMYYVGLVHEDSGQIDSARQAYERAYALDSRSEIAYRLGMLALGSQQTELARSYFDEALRITPDYVPALAGLGQLEIETDQPLQAITTLQRALNLQPEASRIHYLLGLAYRMSGDLVSADMHFSHVPEDTTNHTAMAHEDPWIVEKTRMDVSSRTLARRALHAFNDKRFSEALRLSEFATKADPDNIEIMVNHALTLSTAGRPLAARKRYLEALSEDPDHVRANFLLGRLLADQRDFAKAEAYLRRAAELNPRFMAAHTLLASALMHLQAYEEAVTHYRAASQLSPQDPDLRFWLAAAELLQGNHEAAVASINAALSSGAGSAAIELLGARLHLNDANTLPEMVATSPMGLETRAMLAATQGDFTQSVKLQRRAVEAMEHAGRRTGASIARRRLALYMEGEADVAIWEPKETPILQGAGRP